MQTAQIASDLDPTSPRPWAELKVADGSLEVDVVVMNGLLPFREAQAARGERPLSAAERSKVASSRPGKRRFALSTEKRANPSQAADPGPPNLAEEIHILAVTLDGEYEFVPVSRQRPEYYAHLGWYDPSTKEWTILQFVQDPATTGET